MESILNWNIVTNKKMIPSNLLSSLTGFNYSKNVRDYSIQNLFQIIRLGPESQFDSYVSENKLEPAIKIFLEIDLTSFSPYLALRIDFLYTGIYGNWFDITGGNYFTTYRDSDGTEYNIALKNELNSSAIAFSNLFKSEHLVKARPGYPIYVYTIILMDKEIENKIETVQDLNFEIYMDDKPYTPKEIPPEATQPTVAFTIVTAPVNPIATNVISKFVYQTVWNPDVITDGHGLHFSGAVNYVTDYKFSYEDQQNISITNIVVYDPQYAPENTIYQNDITQTIYLPFPASQYLNLLSLPEIANLYYAYIEVDMNLLTRSPIYADYSYIAATSHKENDYAGTSQILVLTDCVNANTSTYNKFQPIYFRFREMESVFWSPLCKNPVLKFLINFDLNYLNESEMKKFSNLKSFSYFQQNNTQKLITDITLKRFLTLYFC